MDNISSLTSSQKDELMDQVKQQIAVANAQELLTVSLKWFFNRIFSWTHLIKGVCDLMNNLILENDRKMFQKMYI